MVDIVLPRRQMVAFDLDGTLIDSLADIHGALVATLGDDGRISVGDTRRFVGRGARHLVSSALAHLANSGSPVADDSAIDDALHRFRAMYDDAPVHHTKPFPGVVETLREIRVHNVAIAVCTNKPAPLARAVVDVTLPGLVDVVVGPEDVGAHKPNPAMVAHAERRLDASCAVFVGDSIVDRDTAAAHGVPFVGVTWGLGARADLIPAHRVVDDANALRDALAAFVGQASR